MLSRLISGVCKLFRSNSMPCRTHVDLDLQRWDCREVSHAHQVVGCAGEGEDPVHFAHSAMPHFAQQGDRLQPAETLFDALSLLLTESIAGMLCRAPVDCAPTAPCSGSAPHGASLPDVDTRPRNPECRSPYLR